MRYVRYIYSVPEYAAQEVPASIDTGTGPSSKEFSHHFLKQVNEAMVSRQIGINLGSEGLGEGE
jgi:hypothetical protein